MNATSLRSMVGCAVVLCLGNSPVYGQSRLDIKEIAASVYEPETVTNVEGIVGNRRPAVVRNLDRMIFNQHQTPEGTKKHFQNELRLWINVADAKLELTADERAKLWLAGCGDIDTFLNDADEINQMLARGNEAQVVKELGTKLGVLQRKMKKGVCSEGSMLAKVSKRTFDKERTGKVAKHDAERRKFSHAASAKLVIAEIEKTMPLTIEQREQLIGILLKHVPEKLVDHRTYYSHALARLRDKAIEAMFEPAQIQRLRVALRNAKQSGQMAPDHFPNHLIQLEIN